MRQKVKVASLWTIRHRTERIAELEAVNAALERGIASAGVENDQLKRERDEAKNALKKIFGLLLPITCTADSSTVGMVRKIVQMLAEERARLDWLEKNWSDIESHWSGRTADGPRVWYPVMMRDADEYTGLRAAIDAAREEL